MSQIKMALHQWPVCLLLLSLVHHAFPQNDTFRIIDGENASQGEFPFVASILDEKGNLACTASILNDNTILTAAHCLKNKVGSKLLVCMGQVDLSARVTKDKYVYKVKQAIVHPDYRLINIGSGRTHADLGLLKLEKRIRLTKFTRQVCLPTEENAPDLENCIAMGWGKLANGQLPKRLQKVNMRLTHKCRELGDQQRVLCAVGAKGKGDTCYGDSGGPLICSVKGKPTVWLQYGVLSYGDTFNCRGASYYMKVSHYLPWIQKYAQD